MEYNVLLKLFAFAREDSHIVDEALDEFLVAVWLAAHGAASLLNDGGSRDFNLEFVFFVAALRAL